MSRPMTSGAFTVIASTRREWAAGDKRRILAQAGEPGANISEVARRNGVAQSLLYRWRKDAAIAAQRSMSLGERSDMVRFGVSWTALVLAAALTASPAKADFKVPADEAAKLKACEQAVCRLIVKKGPG